MGKVPVPLWAFAVIGLVGVILLSAYITSQFEEATAVEEAARLDEMTLPRLWSTTTQIRSMDGVQKKSTVTPLTPEQ